MEKGKGEVTVLQTTHSGRNGIRYGFLRRTLELPFYLLSVLRGMFKETGRPPK